tara:strand:- start:311 stop:1540 length:1230 start_codon:yes stop_codon:yes gene_type:complete
MRSKLITIQSFLFYCIPIGLLTGPFIPDLFLSFIGLIFIYITFTEKKWQYFNNNFFLLFFIFYIYLLFTSLISDHALYSLKNSFFYFRFGLFALATWFLINEKEHFIKIFSITFSITFLITIFSGYYQFINSINIFGFTGQENRLTLLLNDKLILGGYLARLSPLMIGLLFLNIRNKNEALFYSIISIIIIVLIFLTGERTSIIISIGSAIFILLISHRFRYVGAIVLFLSTIIITLILLNSQNLMKRNIIFTLEQTNVLNYFKAMENKLVLFSPQHQSHFITAYRMFEAKPIFGHGAETFRLICQEDKFQYDTISCSTHPHNTYIQLLSEIGIVGMIPILIIIFHLINRIRLNFSSSLYRLSDYEIFLIATIAITLWPIAPTQNFFNNWINIIYYLPVGFYLQTLYKK